DRLNRASSKRLEEKYMMVYLVWIVGAAVAYTVVRLTTRNAALAVGVVAVAALMAIGSMSDPQPALATIGSVAESGPRWPLSFMREIAAVAVCLGIIGGTIATNFITASRT